MSIKFDEADKSNFYNWLLCDCPCCGHDKPELRKFAPIGGNHIYFAICPCCKNSSEDCKTVYEAVKKWDEKFDIT